MRPKITQQELKRLVHYDPDTGIFTRLVSTIRFPVGSIVGCKRDRGHLSVHLLHKHYKAHRLAWLYMTGNWPSQQIDHIDCDPSNNRWSNLREASNSQNHANSPISKANTSGFKGVRRYKRTAKWMAEIKKDGRYFYLGSYSSPKEAHEAYLLAAKKMFGEFARGG